MLGPTTLTIRSNLASALRHLRYQYKPRTLWIDAICINQEDYAERGDAVCHMGTIYKLANRVVVWFGPEERNSEIALDTLRYLGEQVEISSDGWRLNPPGCDQIT
jgi:hypothetical protein